MSIPVEPMERFCWLIGKSGIEFKQHQYDGVEWCVRNELAKDLPCGINGGFIADEMGLGKTILMIGLMISNLLPKTLIVLPSTLIDQWMKEIKKITGHSPLLFYGKGIKTINRDQFMCAPIVITSYGTLVLPETSAMSMLFSQSWSRIIFDEAHHLRNGGRRFVQARRLLSPRRWLVTGTPVQNRLKDFYNLCASLNLPVDFYNNQENRGKIADHFILRRTKKQVGILVADPVITVEMVDWSYSEELALSRKIHAQLGSSTKKTDEFAGSTNKLKLILDARRMCIFPKMVTEFQGKDGSSKLDRVVRTLVSRVGNGNGKLVFCHFHDEMDEIVARLLVYGVTDVVTIDGRIQRHRRSEILGACHEIVVLQIQVGCEGLNLQADFSEVYFVSPHWNPSIEEQAVARCHRIGQQKQVYVFRFNMDTVVSNEDEDECECEDDRDDMSGLTDVSFNTVESIEQKIVLTQQRKRDVCSTIFG